MHDKLTWLHRARITPLVAMLVVGALTAEVVVWPTTAQAQSDDDEARAKAIERFKEGREAYSNKDFATAIARWEEALALKPNDKLLIYIARAYDQLGKTGKALEYLERYAELGSEQATYVKEELAQVRSNALKVAMRTAQREFGDAVNVATPGAARKPSPPPEENLEIDKVFREVPFAVSTEPPGATVYVDDKEWGAQGKTPANLKLFSGRHTIYVERPYHRPNSTEVYVRPVKAGDPTQKVSLKLERVMVPVELKATPDNADITLIKDDGQQLKLGKGTFKGNLPAGETKFFLRAPGLDQKEFSQTILEADVKESGFAHYDLDMRSSTAIRREELSKTGTLKIEGYLIGADIVVNSKVVGKTPRLELKLSPGPHIVEIKKEGFRPIEQMIRIEPDETVVVETPETLEPLDSGVNWAGWLTLTAGLAVAGGGSYFTLEQMSKQDEADNLTRPAPSDESDQAQAQREMILDLEEEADLNGLISYIMYGAGGALAITGVVLLAIGGDDEVKVVDGSPGWELEVAPTRGGAFVGVAVPWP